MSTWENSLDKYVEDRMIPIMIRGEGYTFRNNSFAGRIQRYDGSQGFIRNNSNGTPDRIVVYKGKFIGLEFKTIAGRQSPDQKRAQALIEGAGGIYKIIRTPENFEELLKEM